MNVGGTCGAQRISLAPAHSPRQVHDAVGICGGFSTKPIDEIPTAVIQAASHYLETDMAVGVLSYVTAVDPVPRPKYTGKNPAVIELLDNERPISKVNSFESIGHYFLPSVFLQEKKQPLIY